MRYYWYNVSMNVLSRGGAGFVVLVHKRENVCFYLPKGLVILKWYNVSMNVLSRRGGKFDLLFHERESARTCQRGWQF